MLQVPRTGDSLNMTLTISGRALGFPSSSFKRNVLLDKDPCSMSADTQCRHNSYRHTYLSYLAKQWPESQVSSRFALARMTLDPGACICAFWSFWELCAMRISSSLNSLHAAVDRLVCLKTLYACNRGVQQTTKLPICLAGADPSYAQIAGWCVSSILRGCHHAT